MNCREGQIGKICTSRVCSAEQLAAQRSRLALFCRETCLNYRAANIHHHILLIQDLFPFPLCKLGTHGLRNHLLQDEITKTAYH